MLDVFAFIYAFWLANKYTLNGARRSRPYVHTLITHSLAEANQRTHAHTHTHNGYTALYRNLYLSLLCSRWIYKICAIFLLTIYSYSNTYACAFSWAYICPSVYVKPNGICTMSA